MPYREKMTVKELIEILNRLDQEKEICKVDSEYGWNLPVQDVIYDEKENIYEID